MSVGRVRIDKVADRVCWDERPARFVHVQPAPQQEVVDQKKLENISCPISFHCYLARCFMQAFVILQTESIVRGYIMIIWRVYFETGKEYSQSELF